MTRQQYQVNKLNNLKYKIPQERADRELEAASFGTPENMKLVIENWEDDAWALNKYETH